MWSLKCQKAFDSLKKVFITVSILLYFDSKKQIVVEIDASNHVVTGVISQYDSDESLRSVVYFFTKMSLAECNYEIYDKELLIIIRTFELWRPELKGIKEPVTVLSDHKNLEYFMTIKLLSRRQARWSEFLSRFNFKITYRPDDLNRRVDVLIRQSEDLPRGKKNHRRKYQWQTILKSENLDIQTFAPSESVLKVRSILLAPMSVVGSSLEPSEPAEPLFEDSEGDPEDPIDEMVALELALDRAYRQDPWIKIIFEALRGGARKLKGVSLTKLDERDERIYFHSDRMLVPDNDDLRLRILRLAHDSPNAGHPEMTKQYELVSRAYWWPGLRNDVRRYVRNCHDCSRFKVSQDKKHGLLKPLSVPDRRWAHISMDFIVGLSLSLDHFERDYTNILVVVDRLSKMVKYIPMDEMDAVTTAKAFYS